MLYQKIILVPVTIFFFCLFLTGCFTPKRLSTSSIPVVKNFDLDRYLGTWYEIARLPNRFEKNLDQVTATYSIREDGKINVLNKGFNSAENSWKEAIGKAWIPDPKIPAKLKVSFFWIFSSEYKIIALDEINYGYSLVTSNAKKYLWILSRTPNMDENTYNKLVEKAREFGFEIERLYKVVHE